MTTHPTPTLISQYASGGADVDDTTIWAVEAHLEGCAACRAVLTDAADPGTRDLLDRVADGIASGIATGPGPVRRHRLLRTGVAARVLPWLVTATGLMLAAALFEWTFDSLPSLVLLIAPVAPLLPVAAVWSRRLDPAWELTATMPRTGLPLLMRRTLGVLSAVIPVLAVAGWFTGHSPGSGCCPSWGSPPARWRWARWWGSTARHSCWPSPGPPVWSCRASPTGTSRRFSPAAACPGGRSPQCR